MTPERRVAQAVRAYLGCCTDCTCGNPGNIIDELGAGVADDALNTIRDALAFGDPEVVRAMAERLGLQFSTHRACLQCVRGFDHAGYCDTALLRIGVHGAWRSIPHANA